MNKNLFFRKIPKVDHILAEPEINKYLLYMDASYISEVVREHLDNLRDVIRDQDDVTIISSAMDTIVSDISYKLGAIIQSSLVRVINCTGVVVHTNLGRSILSEEIFDQIKDKLTRYVNLEYDLKKGSRGSRYDLVESILCRLTGAESALIVNNNAAAVILSINTFCSGKEAVVSRGELVEIGGSFRIPEVMKLGGASLIEVGTTNKTHIKDYQEAINENTGMILKVHTSNYRVIGFSESVDARDLVELAHEKGVLAMEDLGSGLLFNQMPLHTFNEPTIKETLEKGLDIICFSGDKLLGGPQAGIIMGKKCLIDQIKKNQLTRAMRVDKFTLAAMEVILRIYLNKENAMDKIPALSILNQSTEKIKMKAQKLYDALKKENFQEQISVEACLSKVGGGSLPEVTLDSFAVSVYPITMKVSEFEQKLRQYEIPIISRVIDNKIILDMRTVLDDEIEIIVAQLTGHCLERVLHE
ncbi:MAG: L-seryl-tRNA(Sec) selenium transferase [Tissierellales bacterium]|nr:L-seryl-tRNA(Sec) selenium transferase [Tissierellales bacterium]MBN2826998.1 L-seryl-tRNA(Sec) selenium transferase [Tissierellales bacterium]